MLEIQRARIAKQNKARSQRMERDVAKRLKGSRVPMSGAGQIKGDCTVPLDEYRSIYVECKFTAKVDKHHGPSMDIKFSWLEKMQAESRAMRCVFPLLVLRFHNYKEYWVFIPEMGAKVLFDLYGTPDWADCKFFDNAEYKGTKRRFIKDSLLKNTPMRATMKSDRFDCGVYYVVEISFLEELIKKIPH